MRSFLFALPLLLAACSNDSKWAQNVATPPLDMIAEKPGDWSALGGMIGQRPSASGLLDNSPVSVDLKATLGADFARYRKAMMAAEPLTRRGDLLVAAAPDATLVLQPGEYAFRATLREGGAERIWMTHGAAVPALTPAT